MQVDQKRTLLESADEWGLATLAALGDAVHLKKTLCQIPQTKVSVSIRQTACHNKMQS